MMKGDRPACRAWGQSAQPYCRIRKLGTDIQEGVMFMGAIRSFELDRWSGPDGEGRVRHIGMADGKETFDKLREHLEQKGMLPDDYFLMGESWTRGGRELPDFDHALCIPDYGSSEGIYLDISLIYHKDGQQKSIHFATGKTLEESADAFIRMARAAAECSLMLNGRGRTYEKQDIELTLTPEVAGAARDALLYGSCIRPGHEDLLAPVLGQLGYVPCETVTILTRHGGDDFSLWRVDIPEEVMEGIPDAGPGQTGNLDDLLGNLDVQGEGQETWNRLMAGQWNGYSLVPLAVGPDFKGQYLKREEEIRGTKVQIIPVIMRDADEEDEYDMER